jgi:Outer membrane protein beta-barrel domain
MTQRIFSLSCAALLAATTLSAQAQLSAGHLLLSGSVGYSNSHPQDANPVVDTKSSGAFISPRIGYFVAENFVVGLEGTYGSTKQVGITYRPTGSVEQTTKNSYFGIGPFMRYYKPLSAKTAFFVHLSAGFGGDKTKVEVKDTTSSTSLPETKNSRINVSLVPGFTYFPSEHWGLEIMTNAFMVGYSRTRQTEGLPTGANKDDYTTSSFSARADLNSLFTLGALTVSASYYFGGK